MKRTTKSVLFYLLEHRVPFTKSYPKKLPSVKNSELCSQQANPEHPQSISVVFYSIRRKAGCYFLAFYHHSRILCLIFSIGKFLNAHETIPKSTRKLCAFATFFTMWSCHMKVKNKCVSVVQTCLLAYVWELLQWE